MSKKILALAFSLFIVTMPIYAANWVSIGAGSKGVEFFFDKSSMQRDGDSVTIWLKLNHAERTKSGALSSKIQETFNCRRRERITRYIISYDNKDNTGRVIDSLNPEGKWEPVAPETMIWRAMQVACLK